MLVDFRVRPPFGGYLHTHMYRDRQRTARMAEAQGCRPPRALMTGSWADFLAEFDASGLDRAVVPGRAAAGAFGRVPNEDVAAMVREGQGRLVGFAAVDVNGPDPEGELLHAVRELHLAGVALDPGMGDPPRHVDDPALEPIYRRCQELGVPVMLTVSGNAGPDIGFADPVRVDRVAAAFPGLQLVVAHGGWPWVHPMLGVAFRRPNVWLCPDMYMVRMPGVEAYVEAANGFLSERLLFGSSYPFLPLDGALEAWRALPLRPHVQRAVLGDNARRLLKL